MASCSVSSSSSSTLFRSRLVVLQLAVAATLLLTTLAGGGAQAQLQYDYYNKTCPGVEDTVRTALLAKFAADITLPASLLRLHFHDCFAAGCDATIMLKSRNKTAQRDADPNATVRGYEAIEAVKAEVEKKCPLVVSCADIMAMAARDAVNFTRGPAYRVETGRRDGNVSRKEDAERSLPPADGNVTVLTQYFAAQNLSMKDMTVLSAAHTIGVAHCSSFSHRLYNYTGGEGGGQDPSLDPEFAKNLTAVCTPKTMARVQPLDQLSMNTFDTGYFKDVYGRRALLASDAALLNDSFTAPYVTLMATNDSYAPTFFQDFAVSMVKMGRIAVRTGTDGEIRATCAIYVD